MSYALVEDVPASWEQYATVAEAIRRAPAGLIFHVAGPTDEGFRIIELWESEAAWRRYSAEVGADRGLVDPIARSRTVIRDLRAIQVIVGRSRMDE